METNEERRREYIEEINKLERNKIVYIDETGIDETVAKDRGWGVKGKPLIGKRSGKYYQRTNIIAGYVNNKSIAPFVFKGSCNTELFNEWVEKGLTKELEVGQVVIMDNAAFHRSQRTRQLIEDAGCKLIFLPPYSPDLNPIEKFWANMKRWIKDKINNFTELYNVISAFFQCT